MSSWNQLHPDRNFRMLAQGEQYQAIKDYYGEAGIDVYEVKYRTSESPTCEACGCTAGYIVDFQVNDGDVGKLREDILRTSVQVEK